MKAFYQRQLHRGGLVSILVNPYYFARKGLFELIKNYAKNIDGRILDVGCGKKPYRSLFMCSEYIGLEIDTEEGKKNNNADFFYNGESIPFDDASFDAIICNQVLEHVFSPDSFIRELHRVLKAGGKLILSVPFVWDEHEQPRDFARYTSFGLTHILQNNGFDIISDDKTCADSSIIFQLINAYIYKTLQTKYVVFNALYTLLLIAPVNILGLIFSMIFPKNNDLYLDNVVLAKRR